MYDEIKRQREETDRVIRESREMNARLEEAMARLYKQTSVLESSQLKLRESIHELEEKLLLLLSVNPPEINSKII